MSFDPPWWAVAINAQFLPRRALARSMREHGPALKGSVLDVGCGTQPYRACLTAATRVTGLEIDTPENRASEKRADFFYDGMTFPFPDCSFDGVLCNQVLEHVFEPERFLAEVVRVLTPSGVLVLSVPFVWPEHEQPWDSQRFTSFGLAARARDAGLVVRRHDKLVGGGGAICAIAADRINAGLSRWPLPFRLVARALAVAPWSIAGMVLSSRAGESALYLDNFIVACKPEGRS
jgi:SAM-dependent methyltransferase